MASQRNSGDGSLADRLQRNEIWAEMEDYDDEKKRQTYHFNEGVTKAVDAISDSLGWSKSDLVNRAVKFYLVSGIEYDPKITDVVDKEFSAVVELLESEESTNSGQAFWDELEEELGFTYDEDEDRLSISEPPSESLPKFVEFVFDKGYMTEDDVPYRPYKKRKTGRALIKSERFGHTPVKIRNGVWMDTRYDRSYAERYIREICHKFGVGDKGYQPV